MYTIIKSLKSVLTTALLLMSLPQIAVSADSNSKKPTTTDAQVFQQITSLTTRGNLSKESKESWFDVRRNECMADDRVVHHIETGYLNSLAKEILQKKTANELKASQFGFKAKNLPEANGRLDIARLATSQQKGTFSSYLKSFDSFTDVKFDVFDYSITQRKKNNEFNKISLFSRLDVRGKIKGKLVQDKLKIVMAMNGSGTDWKAQSIQFVEGIRIAQNSEPAFRDISQASGLLNTPTHLRREAIRRGGYSIAVTDYNNDDIQDIFVGTGGRGQLFKGKKTGAMTSFDPVESVINDSSFVKSSVFADYDNDGDQDAFLVRFVKDTKANEQIVYYENKNGTFKENNNVFETLTFHANYAMPSAVGDFNHDGFLDMYVGFPGREDFTTISNEVSNKSPHGLFYKKGNKFVGNEGRLTIATANVFPHSAMALDYDQDGRTDLVVIDDRNNLSPLYKNNGDTFTQIAQDIGLGNYGYGMSIAAGDFNNDGLVDFAMTNVVATSDERFYNACPRNWGANPLFKKEKGLRLFQNAGNGKFIDMTEASGIGWPGAATGGVAFFDYDNDGLQDLYVTNGLWSGDKETSDLSSAWTYMNVGHQWSEALKYTNDRTHSEIMDILINFEGDIYSHKKEAGKHPSFAGYQKNRLYKNMGNSQFVDVGYVEGVDAIEDGYAVVTTDLNSDGKIDFILRNADPGVEAHKFDPVKVFVNSTKANNHFMTLKLKDSEGNPDAIGAEVIVKTPKHTTVQQLIANNGPQQYERILHFGLGSYKTADVTVKWPSGKVTNLKSHPAGYHVISNDSKSQKIVLLDSAKH